MRRLGATLLPGFFSSFRDRIAGQRMEGGHSQDSWEKNTFSGALFFSVKAICFEGLQCVF